MISAQYLGMLVEINDLDHENLDYFAFCAKHDFRLQRCASCKLFRYPPSTACPCGAALDSEWVSVEGRGTVHSYTEVHHAIQPAFKQYAPYLVLLVELDTQSGKPTKEEGLRVIGNLTRPDGVLAPRSEVERIGIGPACAWCSPMSRRGWRCRNGPSTRPRAARRGDTEGRGGAARRRAYQAVAIEHPRGWCFWPVLEHRRRAARPGIPGSCGRPMWLLGFELDNQGFGLSRQLVGIAYRSPGTVAHSPKRPKRLSADRETYRS
jgi:uncharacterized OB-fold protein